MNSEVNTDIFICFLVRGAWSKCSIFIKCSINITFSYYLLSGSIYMRFFFVCFVTFSDPEITAVRSSNHSGQMTLLLEFKIVSYLSTLAILPKVSFWHLDFFSQCPCAWSPGGWYPKPLSVNLHCWKPIYKLKSLIRT